MLLEPRLNCATGQLYYTCSSNSFAGCCSIDPCDLLDCPDSSATSGSSSVFSIVPISFVITSAKPSTSLDQSTTESSTSVHTSSSATTTQSLSSTSSSESSLSTSASPTASRESQLSHSTPKTKSETPLIAGLASTLIAFIFIISILVCICRRRRQQRHHSYRRAQHDESKPPSYPSTPQTRGSKDIFAEFGGYFRSPRPTPPVPAEISRYSAVSKEDKNEENALSSYPPAQIHLLDSRPVIAELDDSSVGRKPRLSSFSSRSSSLPPPLSVPKYTYHPPALPESPILPSTVYVPASKRRPPFEERADRERLAANAESNTDHPSTTDAAAESKSKAVPDSLLAVHKVENNSNKIIGKEKSQSES